jgi:hypothetical protein
VSLCVFVRRCDFQEPLLARPGLFSGPADRGTIRRHESVSAAQSCNSALLALFEQVRIPSLSGGWRPTARDGRHAPARHDRLALACKPQLLLADEPPRWTPRSDSDSVAAARLRVGCRVIFVTPRRGGGGGRPDRGDVCRAHRGRGWWPRVRDHVTLHAGAAQSRASGA